MILRMHNIVQYDLLLKHFIAHFDAIHREVPTKIFHDKMFQLRAEISNLHTYWHTICCGLGEATLGFLST